ncbi:MAG: GHKL domain-containing protein [Magnetococcales bacterium]|nr:GHKL domain-containing protein [Magnetococcales bacterium]
MIRRNSVRAKLTVTLIVSLSVMFLLFWWVVSHALQELTAGYLEDRMELEISSILAELALGEGDSIVLNGEHVDALFHFAFSGYYYQITLQGLDAPQMLRSRSLGTFTLALPTLPTGDKARIFIKGPKNETLFTLVRTIPLREKKLTVAVAEDLTPIEEDLDEFLWQYGLISLFFLGLLTLIHIVAVKRAMLPFERIHQDVIRLEMGQIKKLQDDVPEEMKKVVEQINLLLLRMEQRLLRSRSTLSNMAHAIKSPLATLSQIVHHPSVASATDLREDLEERLSTLNELVERELRRARLADYPLSGAFFSPEHALGALIRTLKNINFQKKIEVELDCSPGMLLPFDQEDMTELFGNLLDNAFKWAKGRISVTLEVMTTHSRIRVEDDGPGVHPEEIEYLCQRGVRFDETRPGHGLGLAIVSEIVAHYSGIIRFKRSSTLGGFQVEVELELPGAPVNA